MAGGDPSDLAELYTRRYGGTYKNYATEPFKSGPAAHQSTTWQWGRDVKAVVIEKPQQFGVARVADPTPGPSDAILEIEACGICGTEIHMLERDFAIARYPIVPGHEFRGEVVAVGSRVTSVREGDFVAE